MAFDMKKRLCLAGICTLILLAVLPFIFTGKDQPAGEYMTCGEVYTLTKLLRTFLEDTGEEAAKEEILRSLEETAGGWEPKEYITYELFLNWEDKAALLCDVFTKEERKKLEEVYNRSFYFTKADWYSYFDSLCQQLDKEEKIITKELVVLGDSSNVQDARGNLIEENRVFTQGGQWVKEISDELIPLQKKAEYIVYKDSLWGVRQVQDEAELKNVWIMDADSETVTYFYKDHIIRTQVNDAEISDKEQVADLVFLKGNLYRAELKLEKITGKVLKISAQEAEIKGAGIYTLSDDIQYYRLYDRLENAARSDVRLGYDHADFVLEDGKIQAVLLVRDEEMKNIRVLIKNSDFDGYYHEKIEGRADVDIELMFGDECLSIAAGELFTIGMDSEYFKEGRICLKPKALTGRTVFTGIKRENGGQGYYGSFELEKREEGILLVNELLLEEYLYAVVPSEMPAYYPMEALKAQAISARTYAYNRMLHPGLGSYGANLDDSASYQVYNNIRENVNTTMAVKETRGELLYAGEEPAETYYYSTSCGFGTDASIWRMDGENPLPFLTAREMTAGMAGYTAEEMQKEEIFRQFIFKKDPEHFEAEESWYRWSYEHENMAAIAEKLKSRLEKYPEYVFTSTDGINYGNEPLEDFVITDIQIKSRGVGGTAAQLLIVTDKGQFLIKNEYHIRSVLADGESRVILQDGKSYACGNLLPSAFFVLVPTYEEGKVSQIELIGGGFGHGVGMSQNGAKNLADKGYTARDILEFYYEGCQVRE